MPAEPDRVADEAPEGWKQKLVWHIENALEWFRRNLYYTRLALLGIICVIAALLGVKLSADG